MKSRQQEASAKTEHRAMIIGTGQRTDQRDWSTEEGIQFSQIESARKSTKMNNESLKVYLPTFIILI